MKNQKLWNFIGLVLGLVIVITGIIFACAPADSYSTSYPTKDVEFGADFYTYQYEATRFAAKNTATTANNIRELGHALALYAGFSFIFGGLLVMIHFGKKTFCEAPSSLSATETHSASSPEDAPVQEDMGSPAAETIDPAE